MIDGHVHLENGELSKEYVLQFVDFAKKKNIDCLQILDHTHRFFEFKDCYKKVCQVSPLQEEWFLKKQKNSINEYLSLIEEVKKEDFGIELRFGLEVCYTPETENLLREILSHYHFDFLVGSVHSVDGYLYDMDAFSKELLWNVQSSNVIYQKYFESIKKLIQSNLFTQVGHPDVIKMYQIDPGYDLTSTYIELASLAKEHSIKMEDNTGAHYRYHHPDVGLNTKFRNILNKEKVEIITTSDAHYPEHVGKDFELLRKE